MTKTFDSKPLGRSLLSFAALSLKSLLLFTALFVLFLQARAQVQGWEHTGGNLVSLRKFFHPW